MSDDDRTIIRLYLNGLIQRDVGCGGSVTGGERPAAAPATEPSADDDLDDAVLVPVADALALLDVVNGEVHVLSKDGVLLIGTDWALDRVEEVFRLAGKVALFYADRKDKVVGTRDHYLWLMNRGKTYFFATKARAKLPKRESA